MIKTEQGNEFHLVQDFSESGPSGEYHRPSKYRFAIHSKCNLDPFHSIDRTSQGLGTYNCKRIAQFSGTKFVPKKIITIYIQEILIKIGGPLSLAERSIVDHKKLIPLNNSIACHAGNFQCFVHRGRQQETITSDVETYIPNYIMMDGYIFTGTAFQ